MSPLKMKKTSGGSTPPEWVIDNFRAGLNKLVSDTKLEPNESPDILNMNLTENGLPIKRGGTVAFREEIGSKVKGLASYYTDAASRYLIAASAGTLYYDNGSAWEMITCASGATMSPTNNTNFVQARNKLYIHDKSGLKYLDDNVMKAATNGVSAEFGIYWKGRHVVAGNISYPSRVFISKVDDAGYFIATGTDASAEWFDVQPSDGDKVTGLSTFYDNLLVFKEQSTHKAAPSNSTGDFVSSVSLINNSVGCVSHRTIDSVDNDVFFLSRKGVYVVGNEPNFFDTIRTNEVSAKVHPEIEGITATNYGLTSAIYYNYRYYLSYPFGGTTYNNRVLVYDTRYGAWTLNKGYYPNCFNSYIDSSGAEHLYIGGDNTGKVYEMESGYGDDGADIYSYVKSPALDLGSPDVMKFWIDSTIQSRNTQASIKVDIYIGGEVFKPQTFAIGKTGQSAGWGVNTWGLEVWGLGGNSTITAEVTSNVLKRFRIKKRSTNQQIMVSNTSNNETWTLMSLRGTYRPLSHFVFSSDDKV